jgi:hypothetical protein
MCIAIRCGKSRFHSSSGIGLLPSAAAAALSLLLADPLAASTGQVWTVDDDGPADFPSIQAAIVAAASGDTIQVQPGQYTRIDFLGKQLSIVSTGGPAVTVIDSHLVQGQSAVRRINSQGPALLDGFTIRGGRGTSYTVTGIGWTGGAGVVVAGSELDIARSIIEGNHGGMYGGGVGCVQGTVRIVDTIVRQNSSGQGGGINGWIANIRCERVQVRNNRSTLLGAGGIDMWSRSYGIMDRLELIDVVLAGNVAEYPPAGPIWDGIYNGGEMIVDNVVAESVLNAGWVRFASDRGPSILDIRGDFGFVHGSKWFGTSMGRVQINVHAGPTGPRADLLRIGGTLGVPHEYDESGSLGLLDISVLDDAQVDADVGAIRFLQFASIDRGFTAFATRGLQSGTLMEFSVGPSGGTPAQQLQGLPRSVNARTGSLIDTRTLQSVATSLAVADLEHDGYLDVCVGMPSSLPGWDGQVALLRNAGVGADGVWRGLSGDSLVVGLPGVPRAIATGRFGGDSGSDLAVAFDSGQLTILASSGSGSGTPTFVRSSVPLDSAGVASVPLDGAVALTPDVSGRGRLAVQDAVSGAVAMVTLPPLPVDLTCACDGKFGVGTRVRAAVANAGGSGLPAGAEGEVVFAFAQPMAGQGSIVVRWDGWTGGQVWSNLCGANPCCGDFAGSSGESLSLVSCDQLVSPVLSVDSRIEVACSAGGVAATAAGDLAIAGCSDAGIVKVRIVPESGGPPILTVIELLHPQSDVTVADLNGDGLADVLAALPGISTVAIALRSHTADTEFLPWFPMPVGGTPTRIGSGDIDGDGDVDLAVLTQLADGSTAIELYRNTMTKGGAGLALDLIGYADVGDGVVTSFIIADVSGNGMADLVALMAPSGSGLAEASSSLKVFGIAGELEACRPDLNGDRTVNGMDLGILLAGWGTGSGDSRADVDGDGFVDGVDLAMLLAAWGDCPR